MCRAIHLKLVLYLLISEKHYYQFSLFNRYILILNRVAKSIEDIFWYPKISFDTQNLLITRKCRFFEMFLFKCLPRPDLSKVIQYSGLLLYTLLFTLAWLITCIHKSILNMCLTSRRYQYSKGTKNRQGIPLLVYVSQNKQTMKAYKNCTANNLSFCQRKSLSFSTLPNLIIVCSEAHLHNRE